MHLNAQSDLEAILDKAIPPTTLSMYLSPSPRYPLSEARDCFIDIEMPRLSD